MNPRNSYTRLIQPRICRGVLKLVYRRFYSGFDSYVIYHMRYTDTITLHCFLNVCKNNSLGTLPCKPNIACTLQFQLFDDLFCVVRRHYILNEKMQYYPNPKITQGLHFPTTLYGLWTNPRRFRLCFHTCNKYPDQFVEPTETELLS